MILNHIKITLRYLWRNRLFTALNILGLSIGICACWTIFRIVDYEFSFDKQHPGGERIYQIIYKDINESGQEGGFGGAPLAMYPALDKSIEGLEVVVPVYSRHVIKVNVPQQNGDPDFIVNDPQHFVATTSDYFKMVPHEWLAGAPQTALNAPDKIVLTESRAHEYFPNASIEAVYGRSLTYYTMNDTLTRTVSGIIKDLDYPSSFISKEFIAVSNDDLASTNWLSLNSQNILFAKFKSNESVRPLLDFINAKNDEFTKEDQEEYKYTSWFELLPLNDKHFEPQYSSGARTADKKILYGVIGITVFLLVLAGINYINLTTAQLPQRAKEIGIRKTLGSNPRTLIAHFFLETFIIVLFAFLLSVPLSLIFTELFAEFIPEGLGGFSNFPNLIVFILALMLVITLFSAFYPAWLITRVQTAEVLKGQTDKKLNGTRLTLRKSLIVFQFVIAQVFIIAAIIIGQQLRYSLNKDMGFNHDAVITTSIPFTTDKDIDPFLLKQKLEKYPEISGVSLGHLPLSNNYWGNILFHQMDTVKTQQLVQQKFADEDYLDVYKMKLIAGRNARPSDTLNEYVVNEALTKAYGFKSPEDAIGEFLFNSEKKYPIVGVVADFHQFDLKSEIKPTVIITSSNKRELEAFNIKLAASQPNQWREAIQLVEKEWENIYPSSPFEFKFYDETIEGLYESENNMAKLITLATTVCIIISCLGLFGLATLTAFQRTKEIGVRKVLGASISGIVRLLSADFVKLVLIAILIASPIAWWAMNKWLEDFAYRIEIQWWMFAIAGVLAIAIALITVSSQAIKAAVANPVDSLRDE